MDNEHLKSKLRFKILEMNFKAKSGHIGSALSCIDIMISILKYKKEQDTFILSKGHATSALYSILNEFDEISDELMDTFYKDASIMTGHPAPLKFKSVIFATGSLGHGFPLAAGIAKANKIKKTSGISYVLMSDGETNEGTTWEAAHFAIANKLDNLFVIIDKNRLQGFGNITDVIGDTSNAKVWEAIGFEVIEADGHDINAMNIIKSKLINNKNGIPKLIIANTIKGKGVSFMENTIDWHYLSMNETQYNAALQSINDVYGV